MRFFLLFIFILSTSFCETLKDQLIKEKYISVENKKYEKIRNYNLEKTKFSNFTIKLEVNKKLLEKDTFYGKVTCNVDDIVFSNIKYEVSFDTIIFKFDKDTPKELFFYFKTQEAVNLNFRLFILNEFEYKYIAKHEGLIYGIAYGIILSAFLYNFAIFLYTFQRSFLYYSLMQLSLLIILPSITVLFSQTFITTNQQIYIDVLETLCLLFTILFSKEILNTKKTMKSMNKVLNFLIYLNIVDLIFIFIFNLSLLYEYLPRSVVISVLVLAGIIALIKGQKTAIFYFIGWMILFLSLFIAEQELFGIDELYVIHIGLPLESLILSFALAYKLKQTADEKNEKEKILVHQSKLASMGEMINNIAHQWRQPLAHLSFINMDLQVAQEDNDLDKKYLLDKLNESNNQIDFMSQTIDDFKDFYKPVKTKEFFSISSATQRAIDIIKPSLEVAKIDLVFEIENDKKIKAYENEYSQVVLNFLTNAKDVLIQRDVKEPKIELNLQIKENKSILSVLDNGGGINNNDIERVFEPYFTTKDKSSGIGLYMSKIIVESHFKGEINILNTSKGACFSVEV